MPLFIPPSFHFARRWPLGNAPIAALLIALIIAISSLSACSPTLDWREVRGPDGSFTVLLPAKPATRTRDVEVNGLRLTMTMTSTVVDHVTYAVAVASVPDAAAVQPTLDAMRQALVHNVGGTVVKEKPATNGGPALDIEATGRAGPANDAPLVRLFARFAARGNRVYQAVVIGPEKAVSTDALDTFFTSFKPT